MISCLVKKKVHLRYTFTVDLYRNGNTDLVSDDEDNELEEQHIFSPRLQNLDPNHNGNSESKVTRIPSLHSKNQNIRRMITSESKNLRELHQDPSFHKNLRLMAQNKNGFRNIPISKLLKLPLDFSSVM